jgi:O-antigen/teichoic acid export membrane protein
MRKYTFNATWLVFEKTVRIIATTLVAFYIARYLGPQDFGQLSYALAWLAIFGSLCSLGLDNIVLREISYHPERQNGIFSTAIGMKLFMSLIFVLIVLGVYLSEADDVGMHLILIAACALIFQPLNLCEIFFQAKAESKKIVHFQVIQSLASCILKLWIIHINGPLEWLLWSYVFDACFLGVGIYIRCQMEKGIALSARYFDLQLGKKLLVSAFPMVLTGLSVATYMKIDLIMLGQMASLDELGIYSAAAKLSESWYFIPVAITGAFSPLLFQLKKENQEAFNLKLQELYSLLIWGSILLGMAISLFSSDIIRLIYGARFQMADHVLLIHIWSGVFVCIGLVNSIALLADNKLYQNLIRTLLGGIINISLNFLFIPTFGVLGAAYATLIAYAFSGYFSVILFKNGFHELMLPIKSLIRIPRIFL